MKSDAKRNAKQTAKDTVNKKENINNEDAVIDEDVSVEDIMRKYDRESNTRIWEGTPKIVVGILMALFSVYCIWSTLFSLAGIEIRLSIFVGCILVLGYLTYPASKHHVRPNHMPWYDFVLMILGAVPFFYYAADYMTFVKTIRSASALSSHAMFVVLAIIGILSLVELCRRSVGLPILCVVGALVIYTFATGLNLSRVVYTLFYTTSGILGTPISVCAKYIVVFIIFGAFLERTGIAAFFIEFANAIAGASAGGPAKVAVISSALCGMVSGSSVGNTVTTGSVTIPMMKSTGYDANFAGAVEASASTGGQIMPPIMGAAAFLMVDFIGVKYQEIALRAILPAVLYFAGIFITVHLEAKKLGLKGIPRSDLPKVGYLLRKIYLLLPLVVLIWLVTANIKTLQSAAAIAIIIAMVVSFIENLHGMNRKNFIELLKRFYDALESGGRGVITVAVACSMAGIISGCITVTGLASKLLAAIVTLSGGHIIIALFLTMICCIILGMGVPTTANYCIMASTCAPILIELGIPTLAAHFFVFYFGIVADITPPVALAAYAGSAIAKGNPMKTGINATKLAIAAFIVPYIFAYSPSLLLIDTNALQVVEIIVSSFAGIFAVSAGLEGHLFAKMNPIVRVVSFCTGILLIYPEPITDIIGLCLIIVICLFQRFLAKRKSAVA